MRTQEEHFRDVKSTKHNASGTVITTAVVTALVTTGLTTFLINYLDLNKNKIDNYIVDSLYKSLEIVTTTNNNKNITIADEIVSPKEYKKEDLFITVPSGSSSVNIKKGVIIYYIEQLIKNAIDDFRVEDLANDYNPTGKDPNIYNM